MNKRTLFINAAKKYTNRMRKVADWKEHAVLPLAGAGISSLITAINGRKTKSSLKEKIKLLIRNASLGAMVGGGLEAGRTGIKNLINQLSTDHPIDGNTIVEGNFTED